MTKRRSSKIFAVETEIFFLKKGYSETFPSPPNLAPSLRLWLQKRQRNTKMQFQPMQRGMLRVDLKESGETIEIIACQPPYQSMPNEADVLWHQKRRTHPQLLITTWNQCLPAGTLQDGTKRTLEYLYSLVQNCYYGKLIVVNCHFKYHLYL